MQSWCLYTRSVAFRDVKSRVRKKAYNWWKRRICFDYGVNAASLFFSCFWNLDETLVSETNANNAASSCLSHNITGHQKLTCLSVISRQSHVLKIAIHIRATRPGCWFWEPRFRVWWCVFHCDPPESWRHLEPTNKGKKCAKQEEKYMLYVASGLMLVSSSLSTFDMLEFPWPHTDHIQSHIKRCCSGISGTDGFHFRDFAPDNNNCLNCEIFCSTKTPLFHCFRYRSTKTRVNGERRLKRTVFLLKSLKAPLTKWSVCPPWSDSTCTSWIPLWGEKEINGYNLSPC